MLRQIACSDVYIQVPPPHVQRSIKIYRFIKAIYQGFALAVAFQIRALYPAFCDGEWRNVYFVLRGTNRICVLIPVKDGTLMLCCTL